VIVGVLAITTVLSLLKVRRDAASAPAPAVDEVADDDRPAPGPVPTAPVSAGGRPDPSQRS